MRSTGITTLKKEIRLIVWKIKYRGQYQSHFNIISLFIVYKHLLNKYAQLSSTVVIEIRNGTES